MITSVMRALRDSGWRKTLTPLEMASVPVSAEPPEAKAFITMNSDAPSSSPRPGVPTGTAPGWCSEWAWRSPSDGLDRAHDDEQRHVGDEEVGGHGEDATRLPDAAQVAVGDEHARSRWRSTPWLRVEARGRPTSGRPRRRPPTPPP